MNASLIPAPLRDRWLNASLSIRSSLSLSSAIFEKSLFPRMISFILSSTLWSSWHRNGARWKEGSIQALDETPCHLLSVARQRCAHFTIIIIIPLIPPADGNHENDRGSTKVIRWEENCGRSFLPFRNIQTSLSLSLWI